MCQFDGDEEEEDAVVNQVLDEIGLQVGKQVSQHTWAPRGGAIFPVARLPPRAEAILLVLPLQMVDAPTGKLPAKVEAEADSLSLEELEKMLPKVSEGV